MTQSLLGYEIGLGDRTCIEGGGDKTGHDSTRLGREIRN